MMTRTHGNNFAWLWTLLLAALFVSCIDYIFDDEPQAGTNSEESTGVLTGKVVDVNGASVADVAARLVILDKEAVTGKDGVFSIEAPKDGLAKTTSNAVDTLVLSYAGQRFYLKPIFKLEQEIGSLIMASKELKGNIKSLMADDSVRLSAEFNPAEPADKLRASVPLQLDGQTGDFSGKVYYHFTEESQVFILDITAYNSKGDIAFSNYLFTFTHSTPPVQKGDIKLPGKTGNCDTCETGSSSVNQSNPYRTNIVPWGVARGYVLSGTYKAIDVGDKQFIAITTDGVVEIWGEYPIPKEFSNVKAVTAGGGAFDDQFAALKEDGTVVEWREGKIFDPGLVNIVAISSGHGHTLALKEEGTVVAWGDNESGQIDIPEGLTNVKAIVAGSHHSLALKEDGTVVEWGEYNMQFPEDLAGVKAIAAGNASSLALKEDGTVVHWGINSVTMPAGLTNVKAIAAGYSFGVALKEDGTVVVWGDTIGMNIPSSIVDVKAIAAGKRLIVALKEDGTMVIWGPQTAFPTGLTNVKAIAEGGGGYNIALKEDGTVAGWGWYIPTIPVGLNHVIAIATCWEFEIALKDNGTVITWGQIDYTSFTANLTNIKAIAASAMHALALRKDGTVVAWGEDYYGETIIPKGLSSVKAIAAGHCISVALKEDGTVVAWGENDKGQTSVPAGLNHVKAIAVGDWHTIALKTDGTVTAWGSNSDGQTDVPAGLSNVKAIAAGPDHSVALKNDGSIVAWGNNDRGQVSDVPSGLTNIKAIYGEHLLISAE